MKYIYKENGWWKFNEYNRYVEANEARFPSTIYDLARKERNLIDGELSLHDGIIVGFNLNLEFDEESDCYLQNLEIEVVLSSNNLLRLSYFDVSSFELANPVGCSPMPPISVHEVFEAEDSEYQHTYALVSGDECNVVFQKLLVSQKNNLPEKFLKNRII